MFGISSEYETTQNDCRPSPEQALKAIDRDQADLSAVREALNTVVSFEFGYELQQARDGILVLLGAASVSQLRLDKRRLEVMKSMPTDKVKEPHHEQPEPDEGLAAEQEKQQALDTLKTILTEALARRSGSQVLKHHVFVGNIPGLKP